MSFFTAIFLALRWAWVPCSLQLPQLALVLCTQSSVPPACCPRQICLEFLWLLCCPCSVCCGGGWCPTVAFACAPAVLGGLTPGSCAHGGGCHTILSLQTFPRTCDPPHITTCSAFSLRFEFSCRLLISVGRMLSCKICVVLTGGLQRGAHEAW